MCLKIELLSDLCTYSGEIYNSLADIDVVYDRHGLPYIPAKRIKGCIREAYLELVDFGKYAEETMIKIFGDEGGHEAAFSIGNAYVEFYEDLCLDLERNENNSVTHPQNVLNLYTYIRSQTSIDYKTGSAQKNTLRNMRVVKKGVVFYSDVQFHTELTKEEIDSFIDAAQMVKHMGVRRTRGLGLVRISKIDASHSDQTVKFDVEDFSERNKIPYRIHLKSNIRCKSEEGNQARCRHYISGGQILGQIAGAMKREKFLKLTNNHNKGHEFIVSNAYIECEGKRCIPVPASFQKIKDQTFDDNNEMEIYNMLLKPEVNEQMTPLGIEFMTEQHTVTSVSTVFSYHHKRPEDKSVGHASGLDGASFYQLESLNRDQTFCGYFMADKLQAESLVEALKNKQSFRLGSGKNAEFGEIDLYIDKNISLLDSAEGGQTIEKDFALYLDSAVILYNKNGMLTADINDLVNYLADLLKCDDLECRGCFLKYETVGGYNVTWGRQKPVFTALGKGTVCQLHSDSGADISILKDYFIGERVSEGYGEIHTSLIPQEKIVIRKENVKTEEKQDDKTNIIFQLKKNETKNKLRETARKAASRRRDEYNNTDSTSVISRMILVNKEQNTLEEMENQIDQWSSDSKKRKAQKMMRDIRELTEEFQDNLYLEKQEIYQIVSKEFLMQMKYQNREDNCQKEVNGHE